MRALLALRLRSLTSLCSTMTAFSMSTSGRSCRSVELQGPRPAPLLLQKASHTIKKSPPSRKPVVIHVVSPKVIHVAPSGFMSLVQQLTGAAAGSSSSSSPPAPMTALQVGETSGSGRLPSRGLPAMAEGIRAPPQNVPPSFQSCQAPTRPSDQSASSWYDFFMGPSSAGGVSSSPLLSPGPYVDISCRVSRET